MSLATILYPAPSRGGFDEWSFANYQHHQLIITAAKSEKSISLNMYQIYPFNPLDPTIWLREHQQLHNDTNAALGTVGVDLSDLDWKNRKQLDAWLYSHFTEHQSWAQVLGV